jgi:hypothetical protein
MNPKRPFTRHTATSSDADKNSVIITHEHHPLKGGEVTLLSVSKYRLQVRLSDGTIRKIQRDWTNYDDSSAAAEHSDSSHLCTIEGLRQIMRIVDHDQLPERKG